jgi:Glycosyltransferase family 87
VVELGPQGVSAVSRITHNAFVTRARAMVASWNPQEADALLYGASAVFAGLVAHFSTIALYRQWGLIAVGPYVAAALVAAVLGHRARALGTHPSAARRPVRTGLHLGGARLVLFLIVLVGATAVPMALEISWRQQGNPSLHVQPEVVVVEQAAHRATSGQALYRTYVVNGHVEQADPGLPTYESFFPYLPLMTIFGLPSGGNPGDLTDARIFFSLFTVAVACGALALCRGPDEPKVRILQVLLVLPTAALPLATGGDDLPVVALLLLAMVLAQRRRPGLAGVVLGVASAMKFTAWPLAVLALFCARDRTGRRVPGRMALGIGAVALPIVLPFLWQNPRAFVDNVVLFPLGLVGVASPAATPMPGHILIALFPSLHRLLPVAVALVGGVFLARYLVRRPPVTAGEVASVAGWVMTAGILLAPATRVGYLLYPLNFFIWAYLLNRSTDPDAPQPNAPDAATSMDPVG